jgi:predicted transcriptional regulator
VVKYRRRLEIIVDILNAAGKNNVKKTRIMYIANLSHRLLRKYLKETINIGFMRSSNNGYEVTEKGHAFLERYQEFSSKFSKIEKEFEDLQFEREVLERMCAPTRDAIANQYIRRRKSK